jgi:hypothetical protein
MKHILNNLKILAFLCLSIYMSGCDDYAKKDVEKAIYVNRESLSMFVGDQVQLEASPSDGKTFKWDSENPEIAKVTNAGLVEAVSSGQTSIIASYGNISAKVAVTTVVRIPLQDVLLDATYAEMNVNGKLKFPIVLVPQDANDTGKFSWTSEDRDVATVDSDGEITALADGVTDIVFKGGGFTRTLTVDIASTRAFKGPHIVSAAEPCIILGSDFDTGGEGLAFHEANASNQYNSTYRANNGDTQSSSVDLYDAWAGCVAGTQNGEWLLYTIEVADAGDYDIEVALNAGSQSGNRSFHIEVDDVNISGTVLVAFPTPPPADPNWVWVFPQRTTLTEGRHKVKYYLETAPGNFFGLRITHIP